MNPMEIDFVIPWVDGNDPAWKEEFSHYSTQTGDVRVQRYRDWDLMRYWFRAVEEYAPWVRKIHFVTWGHIPEWLDTTNPKLNIVRHTDYIPEKYLPTFQANTIELNMHRIEGLSEHFVYFNDDLFLAKEVTPEFFFKKGLPCDCFSLQSIVFNPNSIGWTNGSVMAVINKHFHMRQALKKHWKKMLSPRNGIKKVVKTVIHASCHHWFPGLYYGHTTSAYLKSTLETLWELEPEVLDETCRCRFREKTNVNQYIFKFWQLVTGQFYPQKASLTKCYHMRQRNVPQVCSDIRNKAYSAICINDIGEIPDITETVESIRDAFEAVLPNKCSFEKDR